jgi:hypothetical protein
MMSPFESKAISPLFTLPRVSSRPAPTARSDAPINASARSMRASPSRATGIGRARGKVVSMGSHLVIHWGSGRERRVSRASAIAASITR